DQLLPQLQHLRLVQQKRALALRLVMLDLVAGVPLRDLEVVQPRQAAFAVDGCMRVRDHTVAGAQTFDLGAKELQTGFDAIQNVIVVECTPVGRDHLAAVVFCFLAALGHRGNLTRSRGLRYGTGGGYSLPSVGGNTSLIRLASSGVNLTFNASRLAL